MATYVLILGIAGTTTYYLTDTNPETYTLEHRGFTYEIPRVYNPAYNPSAQESSRLKVEVCDEHPSAPVYDDSHFSNRDFPCTAVTYRIEPVDTVLRASSSFGWVGEGKWGFTLATSSQGLVLAEYDEDIAQDNFLEREDAIDKTVIQSGPVQSPNVSAKYDTVVYMEVVNDVVKWLTICRGYETCISYEPLPDDPQYVIRTVAKNPFYDDTGTVENLVWKYKERSKDALALFESFRINPNRTKNSLPDQPANNIDLTFTAPDNSTSAQYDIWLLTTKNGITSINTPPVTSTPEQFIENSNGDYVDVEVVSVEMDKAYTLYGYPKFRQLNCEEDIRQGEFLGLATHENSRYMLWLDLVEQRADTLFRIDDVIDEATHVATFDINDDRSIVRITTPSRFEKGNAVPGTSATIFIDLKNQVYRDIGDPVTFRWIDDGYEYKHINYEECLQNSRSLEPIADPRCDRLIDRTPWTTYVQK